MDTDTVVTGARSANAGVSYKIPSSVGAQKTQSVKKQKVIRVHQGIDC